MIALIEIMTNSRTNDGKPRYTVATEEPILVALEALLRKGQQKDAYRRTIGR
jgi:hypothetical protein